MRILLAWVLLAALSPLHAAQVAGVSLAETVQAEGGQPLVLNGAGVRKKFLFRIYVGALYLPQRAASLDQVLAQSGPKRMLMHFLYDEVKNEQLVDAWNEGFAGNLTAAERAALQERIDTFNAWFETVRRHDQIVLDFLAGGDTRVTVKGQERGVIPGKDFQAALLKVWLGDKPADKDLKRALLGG